VLVVCTGGAGIKSRVGSVLVKGTHRGRALVDGGHRESLARAGLPEHEQRHHAALRGLPHQRGGGAGIDAVVVLRLAEHAVELEDGAPEVHGLQKKVHRVGPNRAPSSGC
jgi:hypothetical protein